MTEEIAYLSAPELVRMYKEKSLSPVEAVNACMAQIEKHDDELNAFRLVARDEALKSARQSERRWMQGEPLGLVDGIPTSIKDSHDVAGWSTLHGSLTTDPAQRALDDTPHVARLREHGAVFVGKTNLCEFGWKVCTDSPRHGVTRNPWNRDLTPAGSSGGAAVAATMGMATINMGGDGGGSIRMPAAFCGIFGIKATYGMVPRYPQESLIACAHFGPLTRTVADSALVMNLITRPDARDVTALPFVERDFTQNLAGGVKGLRIAYSLNFAEVTPDPEIAAIVKAAVRELEAQGAIVEEADPGLANVFETYKILNSAYQAPKIKGRSSEAIAGMDQTLVANARIGETLKATDLLYAGYERARWIEAMDKFHRQYDVLITPTSPVAPFRVWQNNPSHLLERTSAKDHVYCLFNGYLHPTNYTHQPSVSVNCGWDANGLPVGLQIIGPRQSDALLMQVAQTVEMNHPFRRPTFKDGVKHKDTAAIPPASHRC